MPTLLGAVDVVVRPVADEHRPRRRDVERLQHCPERDRVRLHVGEVRRVDAERRCARAGHRVSRRSRGTRAGQCVFDNSPVFSPIDLQRGQHRQRIGLVTQLEFPCLRDTSAAASLEPLLRELLSSCTSAAARDDLVEPTRLLRDAHVVPHRCSAVDERIVTSSSTRSGATCRRRRGARTSGTRRLSIQCDSVPPQSKMTASIRSPINGCGWCRQHGCACPAESRASDGSRPRSSARR